MLSKTEEKLCMHDAATKRTLAALLPPGGRPCALMDYCSVFSDFLMMSS